MTGTPSATVTRGLLRKVRAATVLAQSTEWYDFFLYTTAAALVFPKAFFAPSFSPLAATLSSFATIAVGFIARPIGGAVFGHIGDRRGRKPALVMALILMAVATFAIGLLPGYATIGLAAPILLTVLRIAQGLALGGQWGGAVLMATEYAPVGKRGIYGAWAQIGLPVGLILSSGAFFLVAGLMDQAAFLSYGWRIPFLVGGIVVIAALVLQLRLEDTPAFRVASRAPARRSSPVLTVLRQHPGRILVTVGVFLVVGGSFYIYTTGILAYGTATLGVTRNTMLLVVVVGAAFMGLAIPLFAALSDRVGRRRVFVAGVILTLLWSVPLFLLVNTGRPALIGVGVAVAMFFNGIMYGPTAALFSELFPTEVRYSGASLGYQLSNVVGGGFAPLIMTSLLASTGTTVSISIYIAVLALVTLVSLALLPKAWVAETAVDPIVEGDVTAQASIAGA
jgi:MFS family permease